jgi:uncharacterized surface protein with fasciclin (FAS1) repeats
MDDRTGAPAHRRAEEANGPAGVAAWLWLMPVLLLLALGAIVLTSRDERPSPTAGSTTAPPARRGPTAFAVIDGDPDLSTLSELLRQTGLADVLGETGPFTVFAPDDAAFAALPPGALGALRAEPALAKRVLAHHVVNGRAEAADLRPGGRGILTPTDGSTLTVAVVGGRVEVGPATLVEPDHRAANGVVHVVDTVIVPTGVTFPEPPPPKPPIEAAPAATAAGDVVDVIRAAGRFTQFAALIDGAALDAELRGPGPFTLFAPTDEAFARVPKAVLDAVALDPEAAARLVRAHLGAGLTPAADLVAGPRPTLAGQELTVTFEAGVVKLSAGAGEAATVVNPDVPASNGVVHVVDRVLLPRDLPSG